MGKRSAKTYTAKHQHEVAGLKQELVELRFLLKRYQRLVNCKESDISYSHLNHAEVAEKVYSLERGDMDFLPVINGARDRIIWLAGQLFEKEAVIAELQSQLTQPANEPSDKTPTLVIGNRNFTGATGYFHVCQQCQREFWGEKFHQVCGICLKEDTVRNNKLKSLGSKL